ncbi:MAG: hypothetical protein A3A65_04650 [Candidatus Chisholmbacteria bacterium RIFCSPLOWO2_01_FULL_49_14]|uniref:Uncharacterized protein n=1 Tax=Candidatus Chisholmbacteria bacterium RIFCSPLOWO2_01_FULL_49_14 TaxID=1797593 RepID=A0A1G1W430_9BACT|nr:MAG: hypothetical protein A3A65_04650 [Candidatus Chisholmbacteria bacterium RIFCSPLOWO2_01_FULL_49_14]
MTIIIFLSAFYGVFFVRVQLIRYLMSASMLTTGSNKLGIVIYDLLFFPGILIHELAHFFAANFLGVRTGSIEIFPKEIHGEVKLGSVQVGKSDPVRGALIGSSPLLIGTILLVVLLKWRFPFLFTEPLTAAITSISKGIHWPDAFAFYLLFAVSNTMVLSKSDRKELVPAALLVLGISIIAWISKSMVLLDKIAGVMGEVSGALAITFSAVFVLNLILMLPLIVIVKLLERVLRRKITLK